MTTTATLLIGASSSASAWDAADWQAAQRTVRRLQMRIAKATRERRFDKVRALQWLLTHSFSAKLLAVKRVVQNRGHRTAGVDGITWTTSHQKLEAVRSLKRRGYQPKPLRRINIPKKNGKTRPLGIPTMNDRAMQAFYLLALEPVSETLADRNAYGFRPKRSTADAIVQCFSALAKKHSAQWIFEGDIRACFDRISHPWLLANIPMDRIVLSKWLATDYMENGSWYPTESGTPQGGIFSPTLALMALSGLESAVKNAVSRRQKVNVVVYADDFIITGTSQEVLGTKVKPAVVAFLQERGLELSEEKTRITQIEEGFDFLGFNVRKYSGKLLIQPAKSSVKAFLREIRAFIKSNKSAKTEHLLWQLNPKLRGWSNYYRHAAAKRTFNYIDHKMFQVLLWSWAVRRHPRKRAQWTRKRYFRTHRLCQWLFSTTVRDKQGKAAPLDLVLAGKVAITRHVKIQADATPFDPAFFDYFAARAHSRRVTRGAWPETVADTRFDTHVFRQRRELSGQATGSW